MSRESLEHLYSDRCQCTLICGGRKNREISEFEEVGVLLTSMANKKSQNLKACLIRTTSGSRHPENGVPRTHA